MQEKRELNVGDIFYTKMHEMHKGKIFYTNYGKYHVLNYEDGYFDIRHIWHEPGEVSVYYIGYPGSSTKEVHDEGIRNYEDLFNFFVAEKESLISEEEYRIGILK
jgi:hypothetical protein